MVAFHDTRAFYDGLAPTYDQIYSDWEGAIARQAKALDRVIRRALGTGTLRVLDCACGIGTQLIGLAALGYQMSGGDLSPAAVARATAECETRGLTAGIVAADMRRLPHQDETFDAVVCADNALPHLLTDEDVLQALREMRRVARPGAVILVTTRDYDSIIADRPATAPIQRSGVSGRRVVTTQLWDWHPGSSVYDLTHLQVSETSPGQWATTARVATYRAWTRSELADLARAAGMTDVHWATGTETGFFQPLMIGSP